MMRERSKFWMLLNTLRISFFWIDSDIVLTRNIYDLLLRPDAIASDVIFQLNSSFIIPMKVYHAVMYRMQ